MTLASLRHGLYLAVVAAAAGVLLVAGSALLGTPSFAGGPNLAAWALIAGTAFALVGLWSLVIQVDGHCDDLERLRRTVIALDPARPVLPAKLAGEAGSEVAALAGALEGYAARQAAALAVPQQRWSAILEVVEEGLLAVTEAGLVSLVSPAAAEALGRERVAVGTSVFAALERHDLTDAWARAREAGGPLSVALRLTDGSTIQARLTVPAGLGGAVMVLPARTLARRGAVAHALELHDRPPPPPPLADDLPLHDLPVTVLDTETTGLDVARDRVVSIGAVRLHGGRLFPHESIDMLIDPGRPIPAASSAVHGIDDAMVAGAPGIGEGVARLVTLAEGTVLAGHNIGFDRAILRRQAAEVGVALPALPLLDSGHLASALEPRLSDLNLETLAGRYGVEPRGRHTALGDALVAAEVLARQFALLADRGIATFGEAKAFAARARGLIAQQRQAGWYP
ncbi:MAG: exonuclease domain-containing protein [Azospirillaceae bacterium]